MSFPFHNQPVFKARDLSSLKRRPVEPDEEHLPQVGEVIKERYLIEKMIGRGQFGWVFLVRHIWLGRLFAMKVMHPRVAHDQQWVERFREEARQTSALEHDHVVFVTDFDRCEELGYFFVMEHIEGVTLSSIIKQSAAPMDPWRALQIVFQASDALAAVHEVGVVHRDLKPTNIMVCDREGEDFVKLLDFGISSNVFEVSASAKLYGTPAYMAPEQTRTMDVDGRADQFALCTILYQMLTGERPWKIRRWSDASAAARQEHPLVPVSHTITHPLLNEELDAVIARALSLDVGDRWEDMRAFAYALHVAAGLDVEGWKSNQFSAIRKPHGEDLFANVGEQASMVTLMEQDSCVWSASHQAGEVPALSALTFRTNERLLREWRTGDLSKGKALVHTPRVCAPGEAMSVRMVLEEEQLVMVLTGEVARVQRGQRHPDELGVTRQVRHEVEVCFDEESCARLETVVRTLGGQRELTPQSLVRIERAMGLDDMLSTGEAFLISRLSEPMQIKDLRRLFSGLSFEFDEVLTKLMNKGFVSVDVGVGGALKREGGIAGFESDILGAVSGDEASSLGLYDTHERTISPRTTGESNKVTRTTGHYMYNEDQVSHVLELVAFFKRTHNDAAAVETLRQALDVSPTQGEFYHQLALLYARGEQGPRRAMRAMETALELSPGHPEFVRTQDYIRTLYLRDKNQRHRELKVS